MKKLITAALQVLFVTYLLSSCGGQGKEIALVDLSESELDTTLWDNKDTQILENNIASFDANLFKGSTWKAWKKIHKDCMDAAWLRRPYYMGVSNTINIGSIINKFDGLERRLADAFTEDEIKSMIQYGNFTPCNKTHEITTGVEVVLQADVDVSKIGSDPLEAELTTKIQSSKKTDLKIDKWRTNNIVEGKLKDLLINGDENKKRYLNDLMKDGNRIITKVIEIEGFNAILEFENDISAELEAKLNEGVVANFGNGKFQAEISVVSKKKIQMKSTGNVYVFVELRKTETLHP